LFFIFKSSTYTIHVVGAELQFEADALNKWEVFFLHLVPAVSELRVVLLATDLNPSNLPLELLSKVK
jgi:mitochondrial splicing suppressor protein 51